MFLICTVLLMIYGINKRMTLEIASDLDARRRSTSTASE
jgi:hypothetical protein